ncbi:SDR family NAD(P)-dependent oxidoreductase [Candidatus Nitrososphaera sp. FF02]|uniref:SDR family NAD(P)-dependent oxidoreductase n=1 Tax=Candidatus Nitrososphaera sp. FF02 TaxID=3398226 RepID=UPI0039E97F12
MKGRVAAVTGATRGIGFEIASELARKGATVIVCSRDIESAREAAKKIGSGAHPSALDISNPASVRAFVRRTVARHGRIDILVNNAGYPFDKKIWYRQFHETADGEFDHIVEVDLKGTFRVTRAVIPVMLKKKSGVIISISSTPAIAGHVEGAPYTLAKAGIVAMTKHVAIEYASRGIRAYTLALGNIATDATFNSMSASARKKAAQENAMKRWGDPKEVAKVAAGIAGDDFSFATGNTIIIDGGAVLL